MTRAQSNSNRSSSLGQTIMMVNDKHDPSMSQHMEAVTADASLANHTERLSLWQMIRKHRKVVLYCLAVTSAILLYGYDLVIVGTVGAMPQFQHVFGQTIHNEVIIPSLWLALWGVASPLGAMIGAVFGGYFQDALGRRWSLVFATSLSAIAVAICYVCDLPESIDDRRVVFFVGKLLQGISIGQLLVTAQTYISEVSPTQLRGPLLALFPVGTLLGQLVGAVVVYTQLHVEGSKSYRICFASQWPFSVLTLGLALFIPESPPWLIRKERIDQALQAQSCLDTGKVDSRANIAYLQVSVDAEKEQSSNSTYLECFRNTDLRRTLIVAFIMTVPQLFGLTLLANAAYFLQLAGMKASTSTMFLIIGIAVGIIANFASAWTLTAFGRRPLTLISLLVTFCLWLAMGIAGIWSGVFNYWFIAAAMMLTIFVAGLGCWPASYVIGGETSSLRLRAKTQGIGWFTGGLSTSVLTIVLPYIYNSDAGNLRGKTCFIFAAFSAIGVAVVWFFVPEMKDRSILEIDQMFTLRLTARQFEQWQVDKETPSTHYRADLEPSSVLKGAKGSV